MKKTLFLIVLLIPAVLAAACGTVATPVPDSESLTLEAQGIEVSTESDSHAEVDSHEAVDETAETPEEEHEATATEEVVEPTETEEIVEPTSTPEPTTTIEPTATEEVVEPTATEEEAEEAALSEEDQRIVTLVGRFSDRFNGEELFQSQQTVMMSTGIEALQMCSTCHTVTSDDPMTGPGMLTLAERAGERIPGMPAEVYIVNSIIHPNDYVVEGFVEGQMPTGYADVFTEQEIFDLAAYLLSLGD